VDWYDATSPRGFSRDRSSGWNLEGIGSANTLGMDRNNAHLDHRGLYHYHGVPIGLLKVSTSSHIGYAADGFEIHYVGADAKSSYILKPGTRPTAPGACNWISICKVATVDSNATPAAVTIAIARSVYPLRCGHLRLGLRGCFSDGVDILLR